MSGLERGKMPTYSHSQLSTYETCPHRYKLAYIDKIEAVTEGIEAFMGSRVHDTLEKLYRDLKVAKLNSLDDLLSFYHQAWEKNWDGLIVQIVRKGYNAEDYRCLGERCISEYYSHYHPFDQGKTLGLEEYITFPLDEEKGYLIRGYIDRLTLVDHSILEIHDYKTSGRLPTQEEADSDRQLAFYQMGVQGRWMDIREVRLVWHYLSFDTEIRSSRTPEKLHRVSREALELIQEIETDRHFFPKEGPLCAWCDYQALCPRRRHLVATESLPPNEYLKEEGVTLVNQYVGMIEKKRLLTEEIDTEIAKIEEALYLYAQREKLEAVFGSDHMAKIRTEAKEKFPLKGDPRRRVLDETIKKAGKWMEVSDLNPWMLARLIGRSNWDPSLIKKVKGFSISEQSRSIALSKLKERD
jgi:putative RecB family exonuclease